MDIIYWHDGMPELFVVQSDTSPRIDPTVSCDFSDSDQIENRGRELSMVSLIAEGTPCHAATFQHGGTHVVLYSLRLSRERVAEIAGSFEPQERHG
jgi:hypothetical protein